MTHSNCFAPIRNASLEICQRYVSDHPSDAHGFFSRSNAWEELGESDKALADMNKALELNPNSGGYSTRGVFFHGLGEYQRAVDDLTRARELDEEEWKGSLDPHFRADCYARLGCMDEALADCAFIEDDHWTPGLKGLPAGNKQEFITEIKRLHCRREIERPEPSASTRFERHFRQLLRSELVRCCAAPQSARQNVTFSGAAATFRGRFH